jgi:hypothetical protein
VTKRPREIELSVERPLGPEGPAAGVARLSLRFDLDAEGKGPTPSELAAALDGLKADLDALVGLPIAGAGISRPDRDLTELIETYRPRQRELVDLLRGEGQLTPGEHALLVAYLPGQSAEPAPAPLPGRLADRPIAAVPIAADRFPDTSRPVPLLLREYQITSLRQAGAVRARRQISFSEYMALKRHFEELEAHGTATSSQAPS